jgi:hypothetical protein
VSSIKQPVIFQSFSDYLARTVRAKEKYIPYYLKWVGDCYTHFNRDPGQTIEAREREEFLKILAKHHEDWQVDQAEYALKLYQFFLAKARETPSAERLAVPEAWNTLEDRVREALRLRHRSLSTEKSYVTWFRQRGVLRWPLNRILSGPGPMGTARAPVRPRRGAKSFGR